ncbi:hypothetical protein XENOCAPTIV_003874 [Xenoophorus captivus]|uniref:G-protein coupled receptors family 2 profile 1 domain-containing protein n=1 Tax=Xenoophorus captivus TaxID=1517983 RepID=A0ABV0RNJ4_9TELE
MFVCYCQVPCGCHFLLLAFSQIITLLDCSALFIFSGCPTFWDDIRCWYRAEVGQVVRVSCANVSQLFADNQGKSVPSKHQQ